MPVMKLLYFEDFPQVFSHYQIQGLYGLKVLMSHHLAMTHALLRALLHAYGKREVGRTLKMEKGLKG